MYKFEYKKYWLLCCTAEVRQQLKWADGKLIKSEIDQQVI